MATFKYDEYYSIELINYITKIGVIVYNGLDYLLQEYISTNNNIDEVIYFSDNRWEIDVYGLSSFKFLKTIDPTYFAFEFNTNKRYFALHNTDIEMIYDRIWDCGKTKWIMCIK